VIEGMMQPTPRPRPKRAAAPWGARRGLARLHSRATRVARRRGSTFYSAWPPDENAAGAGEPSRVTLWIDQNAHVVVRIKMSAQLYKRRIDKAGQTFESGSRSRD
jgi:hypothetical protein